MYTWLQAQQLAHLVKQMHQGFTAEDGVFVKSLDSTLKSFSVDRQAYYGGAFIGNHVHKCLKELMQL